MKLSILTTITNPEERQDAWLEALDCYCNLADEIIVVNGGKNMLFAVPLSIEGLTKIKFINLPWPKDWSWEELPLHLNAGLEAATGDWVIKVDIDQMFHEDSFGEIRHRLSNLYAPVATFQKMSIYPGRKFMQKGEMIIAINKNEFPIMCFGEALDAKTDLCSPIYKQTTIEKIGIERKVPIGNIVPYEDAGRTGVSLWNFDYTFKTKKVAKKEFARFARAYKRYFGDAPWGNTEEESWQVFIKMMKSRLAESNYEITDLSVLPKYIREKYEALTPEQFGHSGWGIL